jgi:hypothetical protein
MPQIHLSKGIFEPSRIVPTLTENCFLQFLHFQTLRVARKVFSLPLQFGQIASPFSQRIAAKKSMQSFSSEEK